ncbi:MAG: outer membrane protein, partial [Flavobacteriaceae bacterium]
AADMPQPSPAPAPVESYSTPAPTVWQGVYAGLNAGGVFVTDSYATDLNGYNIAGETVPLGDHNGFIGGAQIGYNWQGASNWVWGIEGDIQYLDYSAGGRTVANIGDTFYAADADILATLRARLGVATGFGLIYATGGLAYSDLEYSVTDTATAAPAGPSTIAASAESDWGWTVGGGAEFMLANNWSVKAEYLYVHFDGETATGVSGGTPFNFAFDDTEMHIARVGLNYRFGSM